MLRQTMCFIGAGSMAEAIIAGLLEKQLTVKENISVFNKADQSRLQKLRQRFGVRCPENKGEAVTSADIVFLAVKPKDVHDAMAQWGPYLKARKHLLVSVVAGITTSHLETYVEEGVPVVRTMPNTSCTVGQSATGIAPGRWAGEGHRRLVEQLFRSVGTVVTLEEELLDTVTGIAGSGPAYVYYLVEAMEKAGIEAGLRPDIARQLTVQTLHGAAEMLVKTAEEPALLREKITSPGGTTSAGLEVLKSHDFTGVVRDAVFSARDRAKQLSEELTASPVK